ncbi:MAG TPA: ribonuclease HII, partial [Allocoleopsis sp.]
MTNFNHSSFSDLPELSYPHKIIAGIDEVGRGCLFGPVVAAAVILPLDILPQLLTAKVNDSKQLSPQKRAKLAVLINQLALDCKIGFATVDEIDNINILKATLLAMKRAIYKLKISPELCLIDGNQKIPDLGINQETIIKGDQRSLLIASASIIAKVWRDDLIIRLAKKYPEYDLANNKGYGTKKHLL